MSETTYAKSACDQCGGHIEFPSEAAGRSLACPHCGRTTMLMVAITGASPHRTCARKWILAGVFTFLVAVVALIVFKVWFSGNTSYGIRAHVLSFERAATNNPGAVLGVVENQTGRSRRDVRVEIELLNGRGEALWATTAFAPVIAPNQSWSFRTSVIDPNAVTARVVRVQALSR